MTTFEPDVRRDELIAARCRELRDDVERSLSEYRTRQLSLARQFRVPGVDPRPYTEATRTAVLERAEQCAEPWDFAWTSGTTSEPKQILYPASRLQALAEHLMDQALLAAEASAVTSQRFFFLNGFAADRSLSALLARARPPSMTANEILADYFALRAAAEGLFPRYATLALSWALIWSFRPSVVTSVNPSSLCMLLRSGCETWPVLREQVRKILDEDNWRTVCGRRGLASIRLEVLDWLAATTAAPSPSELFRDVKLISCWQGGYVRPFLDQLREQLLPHQPNMAPMFSLSTETVATSIYPHLSPAGGLPIYPGCCYEFLPRDAVSAAENVQPPWKLAVGDEYRLVVSDSYGLLRYDTQDLFRCVGHAGDAPLIDFVRRDGLNYSFTGEKLTDSQLQEAFGEVAQANGLSGAALTCFPCRGSGPAPGYIIVLLSRDGGLDQETTARQFDEVLCRINSEYASKRQTDRLAALSLVTMPAELLIAKLAKALPRTAAANPGQFKLLPLYTLLWEDFLSAATDAP